MDGRIAVSPGFFESLRLRLKPLRREDPDFGPLVFVYIANAPERSYWEAEWLFPPVGYPVSIGLDGDQTGPSREARAFYLSRVSEFDRILQEARPQLEKVAREWLDRPLAESLWDDVKLAGFGTDDLKATPPTWEVSFETTGRRWLGITIPMVGDRAQEALVDT